MISQSRFLILISVYCASSISFAVEYKSQEEFVRHGLRQELKTPEERTQFYLLLCKPISAMQESEKIVDLKTRELFQASILTLSSVPRPIDTVSDEVATEAKSDSPAMVFNFDEQDLWDDEIEILSSSVLDCHFPLASDQTKIKEFTEKAAEIFQKNQIAASADNFALLALATDVGLVPRLSETQLDSLKPEYENDPYFKRISYLNRKPLAATKNQIQISNNKARVGQISLAEIQLVPHALDIPWLLK